MNKLFFTLATSMLLVAGATTITAQVTVGSDKAPESFSVLELISGGNRGLRLPQLTTAERDILEATAEFQAKKTGEAMGLQIFNTTTHCVEAWNGTKWIAQCEMCGEIPCIYQPETQPTCEPDYYQTDPSKYVDITVNGFTDGSNTGFVGTANGAYTVPDTKTLRFLTYNLGANPALTPKQQMAYSGADPEDLTVYGGFYQWGRNDLAATFRCAPSNGSASADPKFTQLLADGVNDVAGKFIYGSTGSALAVNSSDWVSPHVNNSNLWGNGGSLAAQYPAPAKTAADPCPAGFRVPTQHEFALISYERGSSLHITDDDDSTNVAGIAGTVTTSGIVWVPVKNGVPNVTWGSNSMSGYALYTQAEWATYDSSKTLYAEDQLADPLMFLPAAGFRSYANGRLQGIGTLGRYRSSITAVTEAYNLYFIRDYVNAHNSTERALGYSVRCVAE